MEFAVKRQILSELLGLAVLLIVILMWAILIFAFEK
jgi:hypothetical protein